MTIETDEGKGRSQDLPYMHPERYRRMPDAASALLRLADVLCGTACELSNQREPAQPWGETPFDRSPVWAYERLSSALNAYWNARHVPMNGGKEVEAILPPTGTVAPGEAPTDEELLAERDAEVAAMRARYPECVKPAMAARTERELRALPLSYRSIVSAPRDGSPILIHCYWEPLTVVGCWKDGKWVVKWDEAAIDDGFEATHWTWLPEDPRGRPRP